MDNRRAFPRRNLIFYLRIVDGATGTMLGRVLDLTPAGLQMVGEEPVPLGETFDLEIRWEEDRADASPLALRATCVRRGQDPNPELHDTGFRFEAVDPETKRRIQALIDRFGFAELRSSG